MSGCNALRLVGRRGPMLQLNWCVSRNVLGQRRISSDQQVNDETVWQRLRAKFPGRKLPKQQSEAETTISLAEGLDGRQPPGPVTAEDFADTASQKVSSTNS